MPGFPSLPQLEVLEEADLRSPLLSHIPKCDGVCCQGNSWGCKVFWEMLLAGCVEVQRPGVWVPLNLGSLDPPFLWGSQGALSILFPLKH